MKKDLIIAKRVFLYCVAIFGSILSLVLAVYSKQIIMSLIYGFAGAFMFALVISLYMLVGLALFRKRLLFYGNIDSTLQKQGVRDVFYESVAGDATGGRIKYGALFIADSNLLFIPHRFSINPSVILLPLDKVMEVKKNGINILKFFAGGLKTRLKIVLKDGKSNEFSVWCVDEWVVEINKRIK